MNLVVCLLLKFELFVGFCNGVFFGVLFVFVGFIGCCVVFVVWLVLLVLLFWCVGCVVLVVVFGNYV